MLSLWDFYSHLSLSIEHKAGSRSATMNAAPLSEAECRLYLNESLIRISDALKKRQWVYISNFGISSLIVALFAQGLAPREGWRMWLGIGSILVIYLIAWGSASSNSWGNVASEPGYPDFVTRDAFMHKEVERLLLLCGEANLTTLLKLLEVPEFRKRWFAPSWLQKHLLKRLVLTA